MKYSTVKRIANKIIQQYKRDESTVIFLGAGASASAGVPVASKIVEYIHNSKELSTFIDSSSSDYSEIMEDLDSGCRKRVLNHFIDRSAVNVTHLIVAILMKFGFVDCVITTNFDPLIKQSLSLLKLKYKVYDIANNVSLAGFNLYYPSIVYLHGEYRNVWQFNIRPEFKKGSSKIKSVLDEIGVNRSWVIVGYSGKDFVFEQLTEFEKFEEGIYWIGYNDEEPIKKVKSNLLSFPEKNSHFISGYDSNSFFDELLSEIECINSMDFGKALESLQLSFRSYEQFENSLNISSSRFELTKNCENWIDRKILESKFQEEQKGIHFNFWKKLIQKLISPFRGRHYYQIKELIRNENASGALLEINQLIKNGTNKPLGYYYKGVVLGLQAEKIIIPSKSLGLYKRMIKAFSQANNLAIKESYQPIELKNIDEIRKTLWHKEHNNGVKYASDKEVAKTVDNPLEFSTNHLKNALVIKPNSPLSWNVLAIVQNKRKKFGKAAEAQEKYISLANSLNIKDYLLFAQFCRLDDQLIKSLDILRRTHTKYPKSVRVIQKLADAYNDNGNSNKSISLVKDLLKQDPQNPQYHLALGTQIYKSIIQYQNQIDRNTDKIFSLQQQIKNTQENDKRIDEIKYKLDQLDTENEKLEEGNNRLEMQAVRHLKQTLKYRQDDDRAYFTLGIVYQNRAKTYFDKRNIEVSDKQVQQYENMAFKCLKKSKKNYKNATDINPDNIKYWKNLLDVYNALDMDEELNRVEKRIHCLD